MEILHILHNKIDKKKWDNCIKNAFNGMLYGYSWYLDMVSPSWDALITEDYEHIMPIPCNKNQIYIPLFTEQLGIFSPVNIGEETIEKFIQAIPKQYKKKEIAFNKYNKIGEYHKPLKNITYEIDLIGSYESIRNKYSEKTIKTLEKKEFKNHSVINNVTPNQLIRLGRNGSFRINKTEVDLVRKISAFGIRSGLIDTFGLYNYYNELVAAGIFFNTHKRSILMFYNSDDKKHEGLNLIIDQFIKKHSEKNLTLNLPVFRNKKAIELFSGYGAKASEYYSLNSNNLPWYCKIFN